MFSHIKETVDAFKGFRRKENQVSKPICYHPELVPILWEQKRPGPAKMHCCDCGQNCICPVCGWGWGSSPCDCDGVRNIPQHEHKELLEDGLGKYSLLWSKLAKS